MHLSQNFTLQRSRTNINSFQSFHEDSNHKQRPLFLTQKNIDTHMSQLQTQAKAVQLQHQANLNKIHEKHQELNKFIDKLDQRVKEVMDHNEAQILFAYKNHVNFVKKQMEQLRMQTQAQANSSSSHLQRIQQLQKQLSIFREQSLILFRKVTQRDKLIEQLKSKINELQTEKIFMDQSLKGAIKRNKELEVKMSSKKLKQNPPEEDFTQKFDVSMIYMNNLKGKCIRNKNRSVLTSANLSKAITINTQNVISSKAPTKDAQALQYQFTPAQEKIFGRKLRLRLQYLQPQLINTIVQAAEQIYSEIQRQKSNRINEYIRQKEVVSRATKMSIRSRSNCTVDYENRPATASSLVKRNDKQTMFQRQKQLTFKNQISEYFTKCIEIIKKQIVKKKNLSSLNFYKEGNPITLTQFKKAEWFRLMELFLSEQKVVQELYKIIINEKR